MYWCCLRRTFAKSHSVTLSLTSFCYILRSACFFSFFFFNDTATTEIYTLSLHDALPISGGRRGWRGRGGKLPRDCLKERSEEHTSELQSPCNLVCRLLLEKKKKKIES